MRELISIETNLSQKGDFLGKQLTKHVVCFQPEQLTEYIPTIVFP